MISAMGRMGLVGGHSIRGIELGPSGPEVLHRHGPEPYVPAHLVDHAANMTALADAGCDRVLAVCSVGGLREELGVGTLVCPDDFIALHLGMSSFDDARGHLVPGFEPGWRSRVIEAWAEHAGAPLRDGGVYWQAIGPRFETPAEIRLISAHADVIGMTMATECIVARELRIDYAAVCVVDNLANGVGPAPLTIEEYEMGLEANRRALQTSLAAVVPALAVERR
jgi:5'-methylthioadenosine phosphorylase